MSNPTDILDRAAAAMRQRPHTAQQLAQTLGKCQSRGYDLITQLLSRGLITTAGWGGPHGRATLYAWKHKQGVAA